MVATPSGISGTSAPPDTTPDTSPARAKVEGTYRREHRSESRTESSCVRRVAVVIDGQARPVPDPE
ncbi:hypothetical protein [Azospirillum rugosum]|uniref:Uncharacterized protein n=1 Tax=Azospirillum rugosum TaxID=416170 RepID=A0ABS4SWS0_9PROT|nr:hypothetical protein [Azospirillum rugosum]MBP2297003.1 hypothetical protein [Azospirillum rugosum]MDQ0530635.1 hypothetical protein [Azospirillum rugosum]